MWIFFEAAYNEFIHQSPYFSFYCPNRDELLFSKLTKYSVYLLFI